VIEAALWGAVAASSLLIGAELAFRLPISRRTNGLILAFGVGALISAVSFELVDEAIASTEGWVVALWLLVGALTYFVGDLLVERRGATDRMHGGPSDAEAKSIVLGAVLDGIPESVVLGLSLVLGEGVSIGLLAGISLSNLPEGLGASKGLVEGGWRKRNIRLMWLLIVVVSAASAGLGYGVLHDASPGVGAAFQAFAAGALITMITDTMVPEAFQESGKLSGLVTTLGFIAALALSSMS
jgi:ZIP family zinc transporter